MTKEDVIQMAKQAGIQELQIDGDAPDYCADAESLRRFAARIAAFEREACLKITETAEFAKVAAYEIKERGKAISWEGDSQTQAKNPPIR